MEGLTLFVAVSRAGEPCFTLEITRVPFTLGASSRCDVVLDDPYVSRKHAVVTLTRGQLHFADTSSNGSFYRGQRIVSQLLDSGDTVEIHPFEVRFEYTLEDDEERHTALRGLDELISPEIRERMRKTATPPAPPPGESPTTEMGHAAVTAAAPEERMASPPDPPAPVEGPDAPAVTLVPTASELASEPGAVAVVEETPPPSPGEEAGTESTEIVPPPVPIPPRRPPLSRAEDRPPPPRAESPKPPEQPEEEPPTIAFATLRPAGAAGDAAEPEGTVHMPVGHMVSLPPFSLEVVDGPPDQVGRTYPLPSREVTVGRGDQADFRLVCENISRLHASFSPQGPGRWLVRDLASLNGSYVGSERITQATLEPGGEVRLANAITLRLGETRGVEPGET